MIPAGRPNNQDSNKLDNDNRIQMFKQIKKDKSKALLLDKNNPLQKERLKEAE